MQKRCLGLTDIHVSVLGLGTVKFGRNEAVKYPHGFSLPSDAEINNLLQLANELGINLLDTAPAYGTSEERLGKALLGQRNKWIIVTKVGEEFVAGKSQFDFQKAAVIKSVERSLQRLQTDYIDVVLVHSSGDDERIINEQEIFVTLSELKTAGKIRAFGMSTKTVAGGLLTIEHADCAMVTFNPLYQEEGSVIAHAYNKKKGILIKKAFASGHLNWQNAADPVQSALQHVFAQPGVTSIIVGTINPEHLRENVLFTKGFFAP